MADSTALRHARTGCTWTNWQGEVIRWYPVKIKHRLWTSSQCWFAKIHVARPEGVILGSPGRGFLRPAQPVFLCPADFAHPTPVDAADGGHELCARCVAIAERIGLVI